MVFVTWFISFKYSVRETLICRLSWLRKYNPCLTFVYTWVSRAQKESFLKNKGSYTHLFLYCLAERGWTLPYDNWLMSWYDTKWKFTEKIWNLTLTNLRLVLAQSGQTLPYDGRLMSWYDTKWKFVEKIWNHTLTFSQLVLTQSG